MWWYTKLFGSIITALLIISIFSTIGFAEANVVLYDGDARKFTDAPDVIAYTNTEHTAPPSEFEITTSGATWPSGPIWRHDNVIALMDPSGWIEAKTTVATDTVGLQFWGDTNDGWARVLVDGSEVWTGSVYGSDVNYPGGAFVKYLEISGLERSTHTIRVECMGIKGAGGGDDVLVSFFGLEETSGTTTSSTAKGLVAHYTFDNNYADSSPYNNHGTPKGNMAFTSGVVGTSAASFDGKSHVEVQDSDSLDLTDDFTFSVWLNKEDAGVGGWAVVFSKGDTSSTSASNSPYALLHASGIHPGVRVAGQIVSSNINTNFNEWYFVTVTKEGSGLKFYVNGELKDTKTASSSIPESDTDLLIGIDPPGATEYFRGSMDDLRIYNYALSQSEINDLYESGDITPATDDVGSQTTAGFSGLVFESRSRPTGSSVQIPLTLSGVDEGIGNMDLTLNYDPSVLEATEVIKGGLTTDSLFDSNIIDGTIKISLADKNGFSGDGTIAYVRFDVIGAEGSSSDLEITKISANRASDLSTISIPSKDGVFKVVSMDDGLGDADGDETLTALDALYALQMAVDKIPDDMTLDMNGDGQISSIDARKILRIATGLE
ncbi:LamG-like jellyroll fold domain-containing protein [Methanolobus sp. WCC4]|uniref:LamG-like jellyroll fold domain-containing protein n=1 Tax=Methanolobus sp. WCC4 TaxID=3125784 RepID=UPI0030F54874